MFAFNRINIIMHADTIICTTLPLRNEREICFLGKIFVLNSALKTSILNRKFYEKTWNLPILKNYRKVLRLWAVKRNSRRFKFLITYNCCLFILCAGILTIHTHSSNVVLIFNLREKKYPTMPDDEIFSHSFMSATI